MPIYKTDGAGVASAIGQVTFGSQTIGKVYFGSTLVFEGTQVFDLTSSVNVNIETFLTGQGASLSSPVIINVAADQIIGSNTAATPALVTGDLSGYTYEVTMNLAGEVQGAAGGDAINATSNITINNTGAIRAGGGNGGNGGQGGYGTDTLVQTGPYYQQTNVYVYRFGDGAISYWAGANVGIAGSGYLYKSPYWYRSAAHVVTNNYYISRYSWTTGTKGSGGAGGLGAGYNQTRTDGASGVSGTYRAGSGGKGGDGGTWGVDGSAGAQGGTGYYMTTSNWSQPASGTSGSAGTSAGRAIVSDSATVTLLGDGVVNGEVI
jgi:hypothetical protein